MPDITIPHDADAEQILLGNCLLSESVAALADLAEPHFYSTDNRKIFTALRSLADAKTPVNLVEVARWLQAHGNSVSPGYVASLGDTGIFTDATLDHYRERLRASLAQREMQREATSLSDRAASGNISVEEIHESAQRIADKSAPKPQAKKTILVYPEAPGKAWTAHASLYCDAVGPSTEASDAYHLASFYTVVGSLLGRSVYVRKGRITYPNLYTVLVGRSGARKGTAMNLALDFMRDVDPNVYVTEQLDSREGFVVDMSEAARSLSDKEVRGPLRIILALEEFRSLIEKAEQKGTKNITPFLCHLYDCPQIARNKSKNNPAEVKLPTLTIHAGTSPSYLENLSLADIEGGFGNRLSWVPGDPKPRKDDPPDPDSAILAHLKRQISDMMMEARERGETRFSMSVPAGKRFKKFYLEEYSPHCNDEVIKVLSERDDQTCLKVATINACLARSWGTIQEEHLEPAIAYVQWLWEARFPVFAGHGLSPAAQTDQKLIEKVKDSGPGGISYRNLQRALHRVDAETFHRRMKALTSPDSALRIGAFGNKRWVYVNE